MRIGSLFTGIGGLDLAIEGEHVWMCEYDKHCRGVLERHWPGVPIYPDIREMDESTPRVDLLHGGYPCQPFSVAGLRGGENDPRHLWPEFARLIRILRPRIVVAENVAGHLRLGFDAVLTDFAALGMDVRWGVVRASDVGAPHQRARLFVVATDTDCGNGNGWSVKGTRPWPARRNEGAAAVTAVKRVNTDGRVHRGDDRIGDQTEPTPVYAGAEGAYAANAVKDRADVAADTKRERGREEHETDIGLRGSGASCQSAPDTDSAGRQKIGQQPGTTLSAASANGHRTSSDTNWGVYAPAIRQWEHILGRSAPAPTENGRLMPSFVEWMMGFPPGWVDGVSRTQALKMLGNAVVPQQAAFAIQLLGEPNGS